MCIEELNDFIYKCYSGYGGQHYELPNRRLQVITRNGVCLPDRDTCYLISSDSDPYIHFTARNCDGNTTMMTTHTKENLLGTRT